METKVTFIYDYKSIEIPKELLELQMPDMEGFIDFQFQTLAEKHSTIELPEGQKHVLTDEMVKKEDLPGLETVEDYREAIRSEVPMVIVSEQTHMILMNYLMPQLVQDSTFEINDEEATEEGRKRLLAFQENAESQGLTLTEAGQREFGIPGMDEGQVRQYLLYLGRTSFLFKVLAQEYLKRQGQTFDLASYSSYIKDLADASGMEEPQVRELVPVHVYMEEVPTLVMLDEMSAWIEPQIRFTASENTEAD